MDTFGRYVVEQEEDGTYTVTDSEAGEPVATGLPYDEALFTAIDLRDRAEA